MCAFTEIPIGRLNVFAQILNKRSAYSYFVQSTYLIVHLRGIVSSFQLDASFIHPANNATRRAEDWIDKTRAARSSCTVSMCIKLWRDRAINNKIVQPTSAVAGVVPALYRYLMLVCFTVLWPTSRNGIPCLVWEGFVRIWFTIMAVLARLYIFIYLGWVSGTLA